MRWTHAHWKQIQQTVKKQQHNLSQQNTERPWRNHGATRARTLMRKLMPRSSAAFAMPRSSAALARCRGRVVVEILQLSRSFNIVNTHVYSEPLQLSACQRFHETRRGKAITTSQFGRTCKSDDSFALSSTVQPTVRTALRQHTWPRSSAALAAHIE